MRYKLAIIFLLLIPLRGMVNPSVADMIRTHGSVAQFYKDKMRQEREQLWKNIAQELELTPEQINTFNHYYTMYVSSLNSQPKGLHIFPSPQQNIPASLAHIVDKAAKDLNVPIHKISAHVNLEDIARLNYEMGENNTFYNIIDINPSDFENIPVNESRGRLSHESAHAHNGDLLERVALGQVFQGDPLKSKSFRDLLHQSEYYADQTAGLINTDYAFDIEASLAPYQSDLGLFDDANPLHPPRALRALKASLLVDELALEEQIKAT